MITLVEKSGDSDFLLICDRDEVFGADIRTHYTIYGGGAKESDFWLMRDLSGNPTASINREVGRVMIACLDEVDADELGQFLRLIGGFDQLRARSELCDRLLPYIGGNLFRAPTMSYPGAFHGRDYSAISETPALDEMYSLLCVVFDDFMPAGRRRWHAFNSYLFRHGLGFAAGIYADGRLVSTGGVYAMTSGHGLIASVATEPAFRGHGCAELITRYLCDRLLSIGKRPILHCAEEPLTAFYERLGFVVSGYWGQINL